MYTLFMKDKKHPIILLVDDDLGLVELLKEGLEDLSFEVMTASNGLEALEVMKEGKIDCLVTDITMPGMNGVELVRNIREKNQHLPVFFITGYMDYPRDVLNAFHPQAVIFKPFDIEEAALLVKNYFLRHQ